MAKQKNRLTYKQRAEAETILRDIVDQVITGTIDQFATLRELAAALSVRYRVTTGDEKEINPAVVRKLATDREIDISAVIKRAAPQAEIDLAGRVAALEEAHRELTEEIRRLKLSTGGLF